VALAAGLALFLPGIRVFTWKEAEREVAWGGIMLIVAGLSLGLVVFETGAARWLAWVLLGQITAVPDVVRPFVIVLAVALLHLLFSSNTVTASIIIPILVALARDLNLDMWSVRGAGRIHVVAGLHPRDRGPDNADPVRGGVLFNQGHGQGRAVDDVGGRRLRGDGPGSHSCDGTLVTAWCDCEGHQCPYGPAEYRVCLSSSWSRRENSRNASASGACL
jgi:hypothetical protein